MSSDAMYVCFFAIPLIVVTSLPGVILTIRDKIKDHKKKQRHKRATEWKKQELCKSSHLVYVHDISPDTVLDIPKLIDLDDPKYYLGSWMSSSHGVCKRLYVDGKPSYNGVILFSIFNDCRTIEDLKIKLDLLGYKMHHWKLELVESEVEE